MVLGNHSAYFSQNSLKNITGAWRTALIPLQGTLPATIQLKIAFDQSGTYEVAADPASIQQIFVNRSVNARDAMPAGRTLLFSCRRVALRPGDTPPTAEMAVGNWIVIEAADAGINDVAFPRKPFVVEELAHTIHQVLHLAVTPWTAYF
jgi:signal transduction histidine kinase